MATDVARLSFDPARHYTGVVPQQGRVSLEAEQNEQRTIDAEERRRELLEIVGPAGTPDNGYAVSSPAPGALTVGPGTMYVGGLRVGLDAPLDVQHQPDWLNQPPGAVTIGGTGHVLLTLTECDVAAVEDPALYEVALGGPDGAARARLLQHVEVRSTQQDTCASALADDEQDWAARGLVLDPATMQLASMSRLQASFQTPEGSTDPCEPTASGGYLGAENQLIRVQITDVNAQMGTFGLVWGYDDASMLYRVTLDPATSDLILDRSPVDDYHRPRAGQAVQLLRATAALTATDAQVEGYVAALNGPVTPLAAPYDPDTKTVRWPASIPPEYSDPNQTPQLYLRVWEEQLTGQSLGTPIDLTGTGVQVTITVEGGTLPHAGDFWCIGVRPGTPTAVYPARLLRTGQPPDGPRQWVCPLAVVTWSPEGVMTVAEDCRHHFPPLVDVTGGCCTLEVTPADAAAGRLQAKLDSVATGRVIEDRAARITVCFAPGHYELVKPIVMSRIHSRITLQGCSRAAVISARAGEESAFDQGLVVLAETNDVTITGLEFQLPLVPRTQLRIRGLSGGVFGRAAVRAVNAAAASGYTSIGIRPVDCTGLEISECLFQFAVGGDLADTDPKADVTGVGVFSAGNVSGTRMLRNEFRHVPLAPIPDGGPRRILVGYLGTAVALPFLAGRNPDALGAAVQGNLLDDVEFTGNQFAGLAVAGYVSAQLGVLRICDNSVRDGYAGFFLQDAGTVANTNLAGSFEVPGADADAVTAIGRQLSAALFDEVAVTLTVFAGTYPLPPLPEEPAGQTRLDPEGLPRLRAAADEQRQAWTARLVEQLAAEHPAPAGAPADTPQRVVFDPSESAPSVDRGLLAAADALRELVRLAPADATGATASPAVQFSRNDIECQLPDGSQSGLALFLVGSREDATPASTAVVGDNRMVVPNGPNTAAISVFGDVTITGNVCIPAASGATSPLTVGAVTRVAITGNVLYRYPRLPANRPFPPPLDTWNPLNTIG